MAIPGNKKRQDNIGVSEAKEIAELVKTTYLKDKSIPVWGNAFWTSLAGVGELSKTRTWQTLKNFARSVSNGKNKSFNWDTMFTGVPRQGEANTTDEFKRVRRTQMKKKWDPISVRQIVDFIITEDIWNFESSQFWNGLKLTVAGGMYTTAEIRELLLVYDPQLFLDLMVPADVVAKLGEHFENADMSILFENFDEDLPDTDVNSQETEDGGSSDLKLENTPNGEKGSARKQKEAKGLSDSSIRNVCDEMDQSTQNFLNCAILETPEAKGLKKPLNDTEELRHFLTIYSKPMEVLAANEVTKVNKSIAGLPDLFGEPVNMEDVADSKPDEESSIEEHRQNKRKNTNRSPDHLKIKKAKNLDIIGVPKADPGTSKSSAIKPEESLEADGKEEKDVRKKARLEKKKAKGSEMFGKAWDVIGKLEKSSSSICREIFQDVKGIVESLKPLYDPASAAERVEIDGSTDGDFLRKLGQWQRSDENLKNKQLAAAFMKMFQLANKSVKMQLEYEKVCLQVAELKQAKDMSEQKKTADPASLILLKLQ